MAGAALLGNSEVAAGMYLFAECGSDYEVICKRMEYRFLRPCYGPAVYRVANAEDVRQKIDAGGEFNIDLDLEITQQLTRRGKDREMERILAAERQSIESRAIRRVYGITLFEDPYLNGLVDGMLWIVAKGWKAVKKLG